MKKTESEIHLPRTIILYTKLKVKIVLFRSGCQLQSDQRGSDHGKTRFSPSETSSSKVSFNTSDWKKTTLGAFSFSIFNAVLSPALESRISMFMTARPRSCVYPK